VHFDYEVEFEELKARAAKKSELGMDFTLRKKVIIIREELGLNSDFVLKINSVDRSRISFVPIMTGRYIRALWRKKLILR
jgi:hypothetical protein